MLICNAHTLKEGGFRGFVVSDWGAQHSTVASANGGLDQEMEWVHAAKYYNEVRRDAEVEILCTR